MADMDYINWYLFTRRADLEGALRFILTEFERFKDKNPDIIDTIRSRIKTAKSIYEKIDRKQKDKLDYSLEDMNDILGVRVICRFLEDIEKVEDFVDEHFEVLPSSPKKIEREDGYRSCNYDIKLKGDILNDNPGWSDLKCEIQIQTILQHSWASKSHELIYKQIAPDPYRRVLKSQSDILNAVEEQSKVIKDEVEKFTEEIRRRKDVFVRYYLETKAQVPPLSEEELKIYKQKNLNFNKLDSEASIRILQFHVSQKLRIFDGLGIRDCVDAFYRYKEKFGMRKELCDLISLLAVTRDDPELDQEAIAFCDYLLRETGYNITARRTKGYVLFWLNRVPEAIKETHAALKTIEDRLATRERREEDISLLSRTKGALAYFIAEQGKAEDKDLAFRYINEARELEDVPAHKDTLGFLKIVFGESIQEVEEGLRLCEEAADDEKTQKEAAYAFLNRHRKKAHEKIAKLLEIKLRGES